MEMARRRPASSRGMEENIMAILDVYGSRDPLHQNADRIAFLDAVRSASLLPEDGPPPTSKMFEAIFGIFRDTDCLELVMASYLLLVELEKRFPSVYQYSEDKGEPNQNQLIIINEAWSPFAFGTEPIAGEKQAGRGRIAAPSRENSTASLNPLDFHLLLEGLAHLAGEEEIGSLDTKLLSKMLLLQYLASVLEVDFYPRSSAFSVLSDNSSWISLRESILNLLLDGFYCRGQDSRQLNYKDLVKNCLFIISAPFPTCAREISGGRRAGSTVTEALALALPEVGKRTQEAVIKLLVMLMELDSSRKKADTKGLMTRADGVRTSVMEIMVDELTYNKDLIEPFLQGFTEPKLKLEIILQYFRKYIAIPSTRTRRSHDPTDDTTISGVLQCFTNSPSTKTMIKKIGGGVAQLLLAHTLQACLSLPRQQLLEVMSDSKGQIPANPLRQLCKSIASAFKAIRSIDGSMEIMPLGKEALFAAATILATES